MSSDPNIIDDQANPEAVTSDRPVIVFEVLEALGKRSFVPLIAFPAILGLTPLGSYVLFALIAGAVLIWVGFQMLIGRTFPHFPNHLAFMRLHSRLAQYFTFRLLDSNYWLDDVPTPRMAWLTNSAFAVLPNFVLICVGLALPALVASGQSIFLVCIAALIYCVSILTKDGRYVLASATVLSIASIGPVLQLAT